MKKKMGFFLGAALLACMLSTSCSQSTDKDEVKRGTESGVLPNYEVIDLSAGGIAGDMQGWDEKTAQWNLITSDNRWYEYEFVATASEHKWKVLSRKTWDAIHYGIPAGENTEVSVGGPAVTLAKDLRAETENCVTHNLVIGHKYKITVIVKEGKVKAMVSLIEAGTPTPPTPEPEPTPNPTPNPQPNPEPNPETFVITFSNPSRGVLTAKRANGGAEFKSGDTATKDEVITFNVVPEANYEVKAWSGATQDGTNKNKATLKVASSITVSVTLKESAPTPQPNPEPNPDEPEIEPEDVPIPRLLDDWITLSKNTNYLIIRWYVKSEEEEPDSYNIYRSETKNGDYVCIKKEYSGSSKNLGTNVRCEYDETSADITTSGKSYYYRISAVCKGVEGKQSEPKGITITPPKAYATGGQCKIEGVLLPSKAKNSIVISENNGDYETRYKKKNGEWSKWVPWTYNGNFKPLCAYEIDCKTGAVYYATSQMIRFEK